MWGSIWRTRVTAVTAIKVDQYNMNLKQYNIISGCDCETRTEYVTCSSTAQGSSPAQHFNKTLLFQSQQLPGQTLKKINCIQSAQGKRPSVIFMLKHLLRASKHAHHNMFTTNLHSPSVSLGGRGKGLERQLER